MLKNKTSPIQTPFGEVNTVAVLGKGVTAKAVQQKMDALGIDLVSEYDADIVIASPGISPDAYPDCQGVIISEIEWAYILFQHFDCLPKLVAVTGTNGKSTVTALIAHLLAAPACGNIGVPLISFVGEPHPLLVVELSSFQLEGCFSFKPDVGVYLNISPDHLLRHGSMDNYVSAKSRMVQCADRSSRVIYNDQDAIISTMIRNCLAEKHPFSPVLLPEACVDAFSLPGAHNLMNLKAAWATATLFEKDEDVLTRRVATFTALSHRLSHVRTYMGVDFYNDSKATNLDSVSVALRAFDRGVCLILCGKEKGFSYDRYLDIFDAHTLRIIVWGGISKRFEQVIQAHTVSAKVIVVKTMAEAVQQGFLAAQKVSGIVLLSPGSSSYDVYKSFEARGEDFVLEVNRL